MKYLIYYLCIVYTLHGRVTGSTFKASNQEIDTFINQLLASQRFDELADKVAEKALRRLKENYTSLIKNVTTTAKRFKQQFRFEEKLRDKDSADLASKEMEHATFNEGNTKKLHSINSKSVKSGTHLENLKLSYNSLKKQAQEKKALANHNSGSSENKPKWMKIENTDENDDHKKASEELERDLSDSHKINIYEKNRDGFEREFHKNFDQNKHSEEFGPSNSEAHKKLNIYDNNRDRFERGNMNLKKGSEELERDNISESQKKNAYESNRERFEKEFHGNIDLRKHSDEIEHDNTENHEKSNYEKNRERFKTEEMPEHVYQKKNSGEIKPFISESQKENIYENRDKFERGQGGLKLTFSSENEDGFERNDANRYDHDQLNINTQKYRDNDVKVHFKSEPDEKLTLPHKDEEKQSHLTLIDVEDVPINRDNKIGDASTHKINMDKEVERESNLEVSHKMQSDEATLKDDHININGEEETEKPSQQVGLGKRLIRKERGKFYTYVSRPEYEEFQEELEKQKEIEKIHRRIE